MAYPALSRVFWRCLNNKHAFICENKTCRTLLGKPQMNGTQSCCYISTTTDFPEFKDLTHIKTHQDLYQFSIEKPDIFWSRLARSRLTWSKDFTTSCKADFDSGKVEWFDGGKLNASGKINF